MESSNLKNMVVLKNLPSNLVEEAIVILKSNKKVKKLEKIEKTRNCNEIKKEFKEKEYILKEAEMLVSNYIEKIEDKKQREMNFNKTKSKKYIRLKKYAYISSFIIFVQALMLMAR